MDRTVPSGSPAPDFSMPDLDGQMHHLADFSGKVLILNFWSAECPWSERVDMDLQQDLPAWGDRVQLVAVASNKNESLSLIKRTTAERRIPLVLYDPNQKLADLFGAFTTPHFFVIDQKGFLRFQGAYDDVSFRQRRPSKKYLPGVVKALLAGNEPSVADTPTFGCIIVRVEDEG